MFPSGFPRVIRSPAYSKTPAATIGWPDLPQRAGLMGVLNITPNSFSDGGHFSLPAAALARAEAIVAEGADILDIGGESTNPKADPIGAEEEIARVLPVLKALEGRLAVPLSIDTYKAETARIAIRHGARIVNDVWGLQRDPDMARVVADHGVGVCLMHNRHETDGNVDILADIARFFDRSLELADKAGIDRAAIVLDPGLGFGKTPEQNLIILNQLTSLHRYGLPLLIGGSRKRFVGAVTGRAEPLDRMAGSLASHVIAVEKGAAFVRAHDVAAHRDALLMAAAIRREALP